MDSHERISRCIFQWEKTLLKLCGHNFIGEPFKPNFITYIVYALVSSCISCEIYTIINYDMSTKLFCVIQFLLILQAIGKIYHIRYADDFMWILNFIQKLYDAHAKTESRARAVYFQKFAMFTEFLFKFLAILVFLATITFFIAPIYIYFVEKQLIPIVPIYMPGVDENTTIGYCILMAYHLILFILGIAGFLAFEFLLEIIIISSLIFGELIAMDTERINDDLDNGAMTDAICRLRNVFVMHQEMAEYMERIEKVTFKVVFIHLSTAAFGSIMCLFAILLLNYLIAAGIMGGLLIQIFINCLLGNCVELSHDQIYDASLQLKWYQLPIREQHFYRFYIERCQGPSMLTVGGFVPLNMETSVQIYSKIYSFTMFLRMMVN